MRTSFLGVMVAAVVISGIITIAVYSASAAYQEPAEAPVSVELPSDEIEIHCEIIKPA